MIAVDRETLSNIAQQLQARCDPVAVGRELAKLVESAKPAMPPDLAVRVKLELEAAGQCRGALHRPKDWKPPCLCRFCAVVRELNVMMPARRKP